VVPPNTTAHVVLPNTTDEIAVGSGAYSWTVPFEPPAALDPTPNWGDLAPDAEA
jgi:hypothetical protein